MENAKATCEKGWDQIQAIWTKNLDGDHLPKVNTKAAVASWATKVGIALILTGVLHKVSRSPMLNVYIMTGAAIIPEAVDAATKKNKSVAASLTGVAEVVRDTAATTLDEGVTAGVKVLAEGTREITDPKQWKEHLGHFTTNQHGFTEIFRTIALVMIPLSLGRAIHSLVARSSSVGAKIGGMIGYLTPMGLGTGWMVWMGLKRTDKSKTTAERIALFFGFPPLNEKLCQKRLARKGYTPDEDPMDDSSS